MEALPHSCGKMRRTIPGAEANQVTGTATTRIEHGPEATAHDADRRRNRSEDPVHPRPFGVRRYPIVVPVKRQDSLKRSDQER